MSATLSKIIIVGGGPAGMTAAHALYKAGIDFVLLESRPQIDFDGGCNVILSSMGMRGLGQLGLLPDLQECSTPLTKFQRIDHDGNDIGDTWLFTFIKESHGAFPRVISRESFMQAFWKNLPQEAREKTHANKRVSSIRTTNDGVVVECADGTSYEGTMVIGADGAYSAVRAQMRRLALEEQERTRSAVSVEAEKPFLTSYRCFWIRFPVLPGLVVGDAVETHGPIITTQFFVGEDSSLLGIYEKLDKSTDSPTRWTQADEAPFVERWRNLPLTKEGRLTLGQAYDHRVAAGWINLEEGVAKYWSHGGRMVLVGDAAHKFTPSTGAGCNEGIVDVVVLTNQLNRAFSTGVPTAETLAEAFRKYQETRFDLVTFGCQLAGRTTNVATWSNTWMKLFDLWIFSIKPIQRFFINLGVKDTARTPVFEWIEGEELIVGNEPWVHAIPKRLM